MPFTRELYIQNDVLLYDTEEEEMSNNITAEVPQGSILGPVLRNLAQDNVLTLNLALPPGVELVGFGNGIILVVQLPLDNWALTTVQLASAAR